MTWTGPGFVDHHAHLLHDAGVRGPMWGGTAAIRALHRACAQRGDTPVDVRLASLGVVACIQPGFALDDAEQARAGLGDAWPLAYRWSALLDAGVRVVTGSDYPIDHLEPLRGLAKLMSNPFDSVSRTDALRLMTRSDAGTMTLSADPADVGVDAIADLQVLATSPSA